MGRSESRGGVDDAHRRKCKFAGQGKEHRRQARFKTRSRVDAKAQLAEIRAANEGGGKRSKRRKRALQAVAKAAEESDGNDEGSDGDSSTAKARKLEDAQSTDQQPDREGYSNLKQCAQPEAAFFQSNFWLGPEPEDGPPSMDLKLLRKKVGVKVQGSAVPAPVEAVSDAGLPPCFRRVFQPRQQGGIGLEKPTPIQAQVWTAALSGADVVGIAPTGSGKTLAYILPAVAHVIGQDRDKQSKGPAAVSCLVLAPTRELAKQVSDVCGGSAANGWVKKMFGLRAGAVYGGIGKELQVDSVVTMGAPHILAATPGRLLDIVNLGVISLSEVTYLVIDEGDRMLKLGFESQLSMIVRNIRPNRQLLLFSATFPQKLQDVAESWMAERRVVIRVSTMEVAAKEVKDLPVAAKDAGAVDEVAVSKKSGGVGAGIAVVTAGKSTLTVSRTINQTVAVCPVLRREQFLVSFIQRIRKQERAAGVRQRAAILVFCGQIKTLRKVEARLQKQGERAAALHSDLQQHVREKALADLKNGAVDTLVATDVASRGLHIGRLRHVVNFDFPQSVDVYCHRIGRVGRAGKEGWSLSFVDSSSKPLLPGLVSLLEACGQPVAEEVRDLAEGRPAAATAMPVDDVPENAAPSTGDQGDDKEIVARGEQADVVMAPQCTEGGGTSSGGPGTKGQSEGEEDSDEELAAAEAAIPGPRLPPKGEAQKKRPTSKQRKAKGKAEVKAKAEARAAAIQAAMAEATRVTWP